MAILAVKIFLPIFDSLPNTPNVVIGSQNYNQILGICLMYRKKYEQSRLEPKISVYLNYHFKYSCKKISCGIRHNFKDQGGGYKFHIEGVYWFKVFHQYLHIQEKVKENVLEQIFSTAGVQSTLFHCDTNVLAKLMDQT